MDSLLEACGLLGFFDADLRVYSSVVHLDKSGPEIFHLAAQRANRENSPASLLFVGEDPDERDVAEAAGWQVAPDPRTGLEATMAGGR